jgi:hypothetical protein
MKPYYIEGMRILGGSIEMKQKIIGKITEIFLLSGKRELY